MKQLMLHDDPAFWFETLRNLGLAAYGGSDVGEVIATASRIPSGHYDSWHDAWLSTARRLETEARGARPVSARDGLGGYLAPRAAAYEPRLAAVVALDGVFDAVGVLTAHLPLPHEEAVRRAASEQDEELDRMIADARARSPILRWALDHGRYVTESASDREFLAEYARHSFKDGNASKITCPVPVCESADDLYYSVAEESDPRKLYRHLTTPKTLLTFTEEEGGDAHCHPGALRLAVARIFDWFDDALRPVTPRHAPDRTTTKEDP